MSDDRLSNPHLSVNQALQNYNHGTNRTKAWILYICFLKNETHESMETCALYMASPGVGF